MLGTRQINVRMYVCDSMGEHVTCVTEDEKYNQNMGLPH